MAHVLAVDDDPAVLFTLSEVLTEAGHLVTTSSDPRGVLQQAKAGRLDEVDLVLVDYAMPELDGLQLLQGLRESGLEIPMVMLTAQGSERLAVRVIQSGAFDYLRKPFDLEELEALVLRASRAGALSREAKRAAALSVMGKPLLGRSVAFRRVMDQALRVATRDVPVLVRGPTGSGKELLASLLHAGSERAAGPMVRFNCAAISEQLAESELFGHVRGAFSGATSDHIGYFQRAHRGTLMLDEVGELSPRLQPKLLRALQAGEIQPVGAGEVRRVDVRVVACTHRDLLSEVHAGRFREDLYYRLAVIELLVPSLAERADDIPLFAQTFARQAAERFGLEGVSLSDELCRALSMRDYPGNVRELENLVTRLVALSSGGSIDIGALNNPLQPVALSGTPTFREQVESLERRLLEEALALEDNNQSAAARRLGLSRATFLDKCKRYGM